MCFLASNHKLLCVPCNFILTPRHCAAFALKIFFPFGVGRPGSAQKMMPGEPGSYETRSCPCHVHVVNEPEHMAPCQRDDDPERTGNDKTIAPQHHFQSAVSHLLGRLPALPVCGMHYD
jgi:hypothetical protein